jgi:chromosome segregation ATPase
MAEVNLNGVITNILNRVENLDARVQNIADRVETLDTKVAALGADTQALRIQLQRVDNNVSGVASQVAELGKSIARIEERQTSRAETLDNHKRQLQALQSDVFDLKVTTAQHEALDTGKDKAKSQAQQTLWTLIKIISLVITGGGVLLSYYLALVK